MDLQDLNRQITGLQITLRPVHDLMPYARNAKDHPEWQVALIAASIKEFGWLVPAVVREDGTLAAGHGRVLAALKLGLEQIPTIEATHLTETQIRAFMLADNKLAELAPWDLEMARTELEELKVEGFDISITGFTEKDLNPWQTNIDNAGSAVDGVDPNLDGIVSTIKVICRQEDREKVEALINEALAEIDGIRVE